MKIMPPGKNSLRCSCMICENTRVAAARKNNTTLRLFFSYAEEERNFTWGHFSYKTVSLKRVFTLLITKTTMTTYWYRNIAREIINSNSSIEKSLSIFQHHIYYLPTYMIVRPTNWMRKFSLSPHNRNRSSLPIQYSLNLTPWFTMS